MVDVLVDPFAAAFMQRALAAGLLAVVATSVVGTWVVLRGLAFLSDAFAHGVIPGIAVAVLFGFNPLLGALAAALTMGGLLALVSGRTLIREDTTIGLLFVGMLSLGVVVVSKAESFATELTGLLFGDVLGVSESDLLVQAGAALLVVASTVVLYRPLLVLAFNRSKAATLGMRPGLAHAALLGLLAVSIVASFQAVGTLLVFGLIVGPPATASLVVRRVPWIMLLSVGLGSVAVVVGLGVSYHHGTAGGATIAGLCVLEFFLVLVGRELASRTRRAVPITA